MRKKMYEAMIEENTRNENTVHWFCENCEKGATKLFMGLVALEKRQS